MSKTLSPLPAPTTRWLKRLTQALTAGLAVCLWGVPGVGKTARIAALAASWRCHVEVLIASTRDVTDFSGLPQFAVDGSGSVRLVAFDWVRRLNEAAARDGRAILFLDEFSTMSLALQAALLRVVNERQVGDVPLHPGVLIVAAANPPECSAGGIPMSAPSANRWAHIVAAPPSTREDAEGWSDWLVASAARLGLDDAAGREAVAIVTSYITMHPGSLYAMPADEEMRAGPWASPRSLEFATRFLASVLRDPDEPEVEAGIVDAIISTVGVEVGTGLAAHAKHRLPDVDGILDGRVPWRFDPAHLDRSMAVLTACSTGAVARSASTEEERAAAKTAAQKAALAATEYKRRAGWIDSAWRLLGTAMDAAATDVAVVGAKALLDWRDNRSGRAGDMTPAEAKGSAALREYIKAKAAA